MVVTTVIILNILSAVISVGNSLTCLSCEKISHPRYCHVVSQCGPNEACYAKTITTPDHAKAYELGCTGQLTNNHVCNSTVKDDSGQRCFGCCSSNLCNAGLCGEIGYPDDRGPICYNCDSRERDDPCNYITFCNKAEVCSISQRVEFSTVLYTNECSQKHVCEAHSLAIVGKRREEVLESDNDLELGTCHDCCSEDLCNSHCSSQTHTDHCLSGPCKNRGTCRDTRGGYTCVCQRGFMGRNCDITDIVDHCLSGPCKNGGTCSDNHSSYTCVCQKGFMGQNCDTTDYCASQRCKHGATCLNHASNFSCNCPPGFTGTFCDIGGLLTAAQK